MELRKCMLHVCVRARLHVCTFCLHVTDMLLMQCTTGSLGVHAVVAGGSPIATVHAHPSNVMSASVCVVLCTFADTGTHSNIIT